MLISVEMKLYIERWSRYEDNIYLSLIERMSVLNMIMYSYET